MSSKAKRISIITLGCPKNQVDSEKLASKLIQAGFEVDHEKTNADIFIVNTCGFIRAAIEESIDMILNLRKQFPRARIISTGCLTQLYKEELASELKEVDALFGVNDDNQLITYLSGQDISFPNTFLDRKLSTPTHYAYLKISEGCNRTCSFCTIPQIRGRLKSIPIEVLVDEAKLLASKGVKELILVSQDTVSYGIDLEGKPQLVRLVRLLSEIDGITWLRIMYLYPSGVTDELIGEIANNEKVVKYFDVPFQHSHNKVLQAMGRNSSTKQLDSLFDKIRSRLPMATIRGTVIVGFPEETHKEFDHLLRFVERHSFEKLAVFPFSLEEKAPIYHKKNTYRFPREKTIQSRFNTLTQIAENITSRANEKYVGTSQRVILEQFDSYNNEWHGRTEYDAPEIDFDLIISSDNSAMLNPGVIKVAKILNLDLYRFKAEFKE